MQRQLEGLVVIAQSRLVLGLARSTRTLLATEREAETAHHQTIGLDSPLRVEWVERKCSRESRLESSSIDRLHRRLHHLQGDSEWREC